METVAGMMSRKHQAEWDALSQEEKDAIDARVDADIKREQQQEQEVKAVELRKAYNDDPELWRKQNLTRKLVGTIVPHIASGADRELTVTFEAYYDGKVRALSRPGDTELELGLAELLAAAYAHLYWIEAQYQRGDTIALCDYWNRTLEGAYRLVRKLSIDLARLRRLAFPILQVNIGHKQQVNNVALVSKAPKGKG
jgi:hypothetical protein